MILTKRHGQIGALMLAATFLIVAPAASFDLIDSPMLADKTETGELPPLADRLPEKPLISDLSRYGRTPGRHGGRLRMLVTRKKDIRYMVVNGYARLAGYDPEYELAADILLDIEVEDDRRFTLSLRPGHKWSDGHPFTSEDFRYYWDDVVNSLALSPSGPPASFLIEGEAPMVEIIDPLTVRYSWSRPNPSFLGLLAQPRPPFIYRPAHYLKQFNQKYADPDALTAKIAAAKSRNWAALHNRKDNMYNFDNPDLPTLQPWFNTTANPRGRFVLKRNPYFHRIDINGRQLPYIDEVVVTVVSSGLAAAKAIAGETDLQSYGLSFADIAILKGGEARGAYGLFLWPSAKASNFALYPNLNCNDRVWRNLFRQREFRHGLSLAIDRQRINRTLFFGLARPVNNAVLPTSPLYDEAMALAGAAYDPEATNRMFDAIGLARRDDDGIRLLPDGRVMELVVETAGENLVQIDILQLIVRDMRKVGIKLLIKPSQRDVMRNRAFSGDALMTVWEGWDNGIPSASMNPSFLAPVHQDMLIWPKWGQYYQTKGVSGEPVDLVAAQELTNLYQQWLRGDTAQRPIWQEMLAIHAEQQFIIGVLSSVPQPIVVSTQLRNVPVEQPYGWLPMAHFAPARMDHFWFIP